MLLHRALYLPVSACASCRLRASITAKQLASQKSSVFGSAKYAAFGTSARIGQENLKQVAGTKNDDSRIVGGLRVLLDQLDADAEAFGADLDRLSANLGRVAKDDGRVDDSRKEEKSREEKVRHARSKHGDALPDGLLTEEEYRVYERLYGRPVQQSGKRRDLLQEDPARAESVVLLLREDGEGRVEEVGYEREDPLADREGDTMSADDARLARDIRFAVRDMVSDASRDTVDYDGDSPGRTHPLTIAHRFGTSPSTLQLPRDTFVDPATLLLSGMPAVHLESAAHRVFGGVGLPYSTSTPALAKTMQQRPIALDAYQNSMSDIEADVYMACVMPAILASVIGVLVETRKRLGTVWAENLVRKAAAGELRILDAGGGGAGVLAVREVLRAEWIRMHEDDPAVYLPTSVAEADGKLGGAGVSPPQGIATVLTGSDTLRKRASQLLDNTTFIPRLPNYLHTETAQQKGKFDIVVAPHTLWPLREDYLRKSHAQNLWSLLNSDGGVLLLLEKGVARGFEMVAAARDMLIETRITSPGRDQRSLDIYSPEAVEVDFEDSSSMHSGHVIAKDAAGRIIAPCTHHAGCPIYVEKGLVKGRRDICHFEQRYVRPAFLQKILGARDKNYEDVQFSYVSMMRGGDQQNHHAAVTAEEGEAATTRAFVGYADVDVAPSPPLLLPRAVATPIKRQGHVILDLCTPAGTLERWTVPRSFGKVAFRDARKSAWGDLWALGAKTRVPKNIRGVKPRKPEVKGRKRSHNEVDGGSLGLDEHGRIVVGGTMGGDGVKISGEGGKMRGLRIVKGIRDKRDKKGTGNGRLKQKRSAKED